MSMICCFFGVYVDLLRFLELKFFPRLSHLFHLCAGRSGRWWRGYCNVLAVSRTGPGGATKRFLLDDGCIGVGRHDEE